MNLRTVKWAQWDKTQSRELLVCSYVCASHCAQLLRTILHRTELIIFSLTLQTITIAPMTSIWGNGVRVNGMIVCIELNGFVPLSIVLLAIGIRRYKPAWDTPQYLQYRSYCTICNSLRVCGLNAKLPTHRMSTHCIGSFRDNTTKRQLRNMFLPDIMRLPLVGLHKLLI